MSAIDTPDSATEVEERYLKIVRHSGGMVNHFLPKSSLHRRLCSGQKALIVPPPVSYGYPWYTAVEQDGAIELTTKPSIWADTWASTAASPSLLVHQSLWTLLSGSEPEGYVVTLAGWHERGFSWRVWMETVDATRTSAALPCKHDRTIAKIETLAQLEADAAWRVDKLLEQMEAVRSITDPKVLADVLASSENIGPETPMGTARLLVDFVSERAQQKLDGRRTANLSDMPTAADRQEMIAAELEVLLGNTWKVDDGVLKRDSWWIQRLTPAAICPEHYLDI